MSIVCNSGTDFEVGQNVFILNANTHPLTVAASEGAMVHPLETLSFLVHSQLLPSP